MPYKLKHNKDNTYELLNKNTGHILAYNTTPDKAMKQIKAIHASKNKLPKQKKRTKHTGMPKHHRIRKNVEILQNRIIKNPKHRQFIDMTKKLLKHEEMVGSGFWSDLWDITKDVISLPFDIIENVPFVKPAVELGLSAIIGPEAVPLIEAGIGINKMIFGDTNQGLKDTWNPKDDEPAPQQHSAPGLAEPEEQETIADVVDDTVQDIVDESIVVPARPQTSREEILNPYGQNESTMFNPLQHLISSSALAFPMNQRFDPREQPLSLVNFLNTQSMAGLKVSDAEYDAIVRKQKPETWLSFPANGFYKLYPSYQTGIN